MDRRLRNRILLYLALAAVLAYAGIKLSERKPVPKVSAVTPMRENLVSSISSNGKVEPISPYVMRAQLDTFVEKVRATEGQTVKKGQVILELDVKDAAARLSEAKSKLLKAEDDLRAAMAGGRTDDAAKVAVASLAKMQAERDRLQKNHEVLQRLIAQQAATQDELAANDLALTKAQAEVTRLAASKQEFERSLKLDMDQAALHVQQIQNEVAALDEKVRQGRITAPADGTLYSLPVKAGDYVKLGELLAEMADLHKVRVRAFIDEPELGALEANEPVKITWDALPSKTWVGKTENIPKQVVPHQNRSVGELLCAVNNDKLELLPNINVNVRINSRERIGVLSVPRGAVAAEGGRRYVYVVRKNQLGVGKSTLEKREIHVGIADATNYEVVSGLQEGDLVALPGDVDLRDGMTVTVITTEVLIFRRDGMVRRMWLLAAVGLASGAMAAATVKQEASLEAGRRAYEASEYTKAIQTLQAAAAREPQNGDVQLLLTKSYLELEEHDPAIRSAEKAVAIDPQNSVYHEWLGRAYGEKADHVNPISAMGLARKTGKEFEMAVQLDAKNYSARQALIEFDCRSPGIVGGGEDKALPQIKQLAEMDAAEGHYAAGNCRRQKKDFAVADEEFTKALESNPKSTELIYDIGDYAVKRGQPERLLALADTGERVAPADPRGKFYRGIALVLKKENLEEAERLLRAYAKKAPMRSGYPRPAAAHAWLGRLFESQSRREDAVKEYETALKLDPKNKMAQEAMKRLKKS